MARVVETRHNGSSLRAATRETLQARSSEQARQMAAVLSTQPSTACRLPRRSTSCPKPATRYHVIFLSQILIKNVLCFSARVSLWVLVNQRFSEARGLCLQRAPRATVVTRATVFSLAAADVVPTTPTGRSQRLMRWMRRMIPRVPYIVLVCFRRHFTEP